MSQGSAKSVKYVLLDEIADYYTHGQSVIFYNHRQRLSEQTYFHNFEGVFKDLRFSDAAFFDMKFVRGTVRDYFFLVRPEHIKENILLFDFELTDREMAQINALNRDE